MRLLLVEDEAGLARALARGLSAEGFAVDVVHDGSSGLERAVHEAYDVVVLDVMLPRLSGYDVVRRLRAQGVWTPVLMLSAKDGEHDQADGLDVGADDYLTKPFSFVVLVARLLDRQHLGQPVGGGERGDGLGAVLRQVVQRHHPRAGQQARQRQRADDQPGAEHPGRERSEPEPQRPAGPPPHPTTR